MNNARPIMRVIECITKLTRPTGNLIRVKNLLFFFRAQVRQRVPVDVFHRDAGGGLIKHEVVNSHDVLVRQLETALGLAFEFVQQ